MLYDSHIWVWRREAIKKKFSKTLEYLKEHEMIQSDDYKRGWFDGYHAAKNEKQSWANPPKPTYSNKCSVCGICGMEWGDKVWGYVCMNDSCPSKVTASNMPKATITPLSDTDYPYQQPNIMTSQVSITRGPK